MPTRRCVRRVPAPAPLLAVAVLLAGLLGGCSGKDAGPVERISSGADVDVVDGLAYGERDGQPLLLDVCSPRGGGSDLPALVLVHGGGFTSGDRASGGMRGLCEAAARQGAVGVSVDYGLAPASTFPGPVEDVQAAVAWLREPAQVERFGLDPAHVGVMGSSAGAILALAVGTAGTGPTDTGSRVDAVVSLSGVGDFRPAALELGTPGPEAQAMALAYLGCTDPLACPAADAASAVTQVDPTDPPVLLVNGSSELVPVEQADAVSAALEAAGVRHEQVVVTGSSHGTALLTPDVRPRVWTFLEENL